MSVQRRPRDVSLLWLLYTGLLLLVLPVASIVMASIETPVRLTPDERRLPAPLLCPVDGESVESREHGLTWQGRRYYMDSEVCLREFMADPETFAKRIEPRAALLSAPRTDQPSYSPRVLYVSLLVVIGLVSGAVTSYVAVQKGLSGMTWFALGFVLNVFGIVMVLFCRGRETLFRTAGLCKTPQTFTPTPCPHCGKTNHPSAARCSGCGTTLSPAVESDVARAG
jgi:YHS domain-containing protein